MVVATTHYDALKTYASTTEGVTPAGFGFDPETFAPTYRLNYGSPGQQPGARDRDAARPAGRDHRARARTAASARRSSPSTSPRSSATCRRSSTSAPLAARERETLAEAAAKLQIASRSCEPRGDVPPPPRREDRRAAARGAPRDRRRGRRAQGDRRRWPTRGANGPRAARLIPTGETGGARADARAAIDAIAARRRPSGRNAGRRRRRRRAGAVGRRRVGDRVVVGAARPRRRRAGGHDGRRGRRPRQAAARARRRDLRVVDRRGAAAPADASASTSSCSRARASLTELNVIGCNVDEALDAPRSSSTRRRSPSSGACGSSTATAPGSCAARSRISEDAPVRRATSARRPRTGRRRRHRRGAEGLDAWVSFPLRSSTT